MKANPKADHFDLIGGIYDQGGFEVRRAISDVYQRFTAGRKNWKDLLDSGNFLRVFSSHRRFVIRVTLSRRLNRLGRRLFGR